MRYSFYVILLFYLYMFLISIFAIYCSEKMRKIVFMLQIISISLFYGFRDLDIGADTYEYSRLYLSQYIHPDIGFTFINKLMYIFIGDNVKLYLFIFTLLVSLIIGLFYYFILGINNKYVCLAYTCMYCMPYSIMMTVNIIRQGLSVSLFFLGILLYVYYKKKIGVVLVVFSLFMHSSTIVIFLLFYSLRRAKVKNITILFLSLFFVILNYIVIFNYINILNSLPDNYFLLFKFKDYIGDNLGKVNVVYKYLFYFINFMFMIYLSSKKCSFIQKFILDIIGPIILFSSMVYFNQLVATRLLANIDLLLPVYYISSINSIKENKLYLYLFTFIIIILFVIVMNSHMMKVTFCM